MCKVSNLGFLGWKFYIGLKMKNNGDAGRRSKIGGSKGGSR